MVRVSGRLQRLMVAAIIRIPFDGLQGAMLFPSLSDLQASFFLTHAEITSDLGALCWFTLPGRLFSEVSAWMAPSHLATAQMSPPQRGSLPVGFVGF